MEEYDLYQEGGTRQRPSGINDQMKKFGMGNFDDNLETSSSTDTTESDPQQSNLSTNAPVIYNDFPMTEVQSVSVEEPVKIYKAKDRNPKRAAKTKKGAKSYAVKSVGTVSTKCRSAGGCRESFDSWDAMDYHMSTYHAEGVKRTFCCHLCQKTMSRKGYLEKHVKSVHMGQKSFHCPFSMCSSAFAQKSNLEAHTESIHIKKNELKCTKCLFKTYHKRSLRRHMANSRHHY